MVIPLFGVKDTAVLGISTPLDENNMYSQLCDLKQDDGKTPLFNVISITLICDECQGKDLEGQITCPHKQNEIPPWKTSRRQDLVKKLLESNPEVRGWRSGRGSAPSTPAIGRCAPIPTLLCNCCAFAVFGSGGPSRG